MLTFGVNQKILFELKKRYFIRLSYKGTNYHGWQIQPNASSVQEELNKALSTILNQPINVVGCGRTDTGVHASDFMAHFEVDENCRFDCGKLTFKLNRFLPHDIAIREVFRVKADAHTRFDAISRTYHYKITKHKNPFRMESHWKNQHELNVSKMNEAAKILFEYIDFTSFSKLHTDVKTNNCRISKAEWTETDDELVFTIKADRFLRNMVRAIVGTLIEVGRGKMDLAGFREVIESKNRSNAGSSVPGHGLFLAKIEYPDGLRIEDE
ncbi:tRNA pseudouridine(38-40) synthase TruA [Labilibaculum sp. A4]|uniref:tRNA pseudouridine(38-40) synthase TruA n=1 Tax=Labilibaculum euxinus TaxID=2686357 RepID=UPI000F61913C|nr:tRNA pseudouridine(38-40) synthase TruA [Labilibaculum euxinus]MDQ1771190.1 tRNA pseudouridine(38-40) synthase TruA [Labilibaculum euxinus]MWN76803.1 tRNA pseudouridine(38-40) synthase TruA [Labilibaculum euxinus]